MSPSSDEESDSIPHFVREESRAVVEDILPSLSKNLYLKAYNDFMKWLAKKNVKSLSESVFITYFSELAKTKHNGPSTLWNKFSMLKATMSTKHQINIKEYTMLLEYLRKQSNGYKKKISKIFTANDVETFLYQAPNKTYLATKVILIFGINGGCGNNDLTNITVEDVKKRNSLFLVKLPSTPMKKDRVFIIREKSAKLVEKYIALRPSNTNTKRFFLSYHEGKCVRQVIGKNKIAIMPKEIATYLKLPNPELYTGNSFRRTSAAILADSEAKLNLIDNLGGSENERHVMDQQQSEDDESESSQDGYQIQLEKNKSIHTDSSNVLIEIESLPVIEKVESTSAKSLGKAMKHLCNLFGLNHELPLQDIRQELRLKTDMSHHNLNVDVPKANMCTSIHVSQMPTWFNFFHVKALIKLKSDFDVDSEFYDIDMFKDDHNKQMHECIIRFIENKDCLQVYRDLQGICLDEEPMIVTLDLDHEIAENERERCRPKFEEKLKKFNEKRARDKENNAQFRENGTIKEENEEVTDPLITVPTEFTIDVDVPLKTEILVYPVKNDQEPVDATKDIDVPIKTETLEILVEDDHESIDLTKDEDITFNTNTFALAFPTNDNKLNKNDVIYIKSFHMDESSDQNIEEDNNENISQETTQEKTQMEKETSQDELAHDSGAPQSAYNRHNCSIIHIKNFPSENTYNFIFILKGLLTCESGTESKFRYTEVKKNNEVATDLLLQFESHKEAVTACKLLDGMTFHGNKLEVSMGYTFNKNITAKDLQSFEHKRKLIHDPDIETEQTYKKVRTETPFTPSTPVGHRTAPTEVCHETFELRNEFINSLGIKPPFTHRIIVSNLHSTVTEAKLLEVFSLAGDVKRVHLFTDVTKVHQDQGKIEYDHPLEALQAISMLNKHKLYNQEMIVQMDRSQEEYPLPQGLSSVGQGLGINGLPLRGARIQAEMQKIHKTFVEFGMMEEIPNENFNLDERRKDFIIPFKYSFNKCACVNVPDSKTESRKQNSDDNSSPLAKTSRSQSGDHNYCSKRDTKHSRSSIERDSKRRSNEEKEYSSKDRKKKNNKRIRDREEQCSNESEEEQPSRESEEPGHSENSEMVVFSNLPASMTSQSLMKRMRVIGEVIVCDVTDDRRAFLRFGKSQDADRCIRLFHRAKLDGQVIDAKFL